MIKEEISLFELDSYLQDIEDFDAMEMHRLVDEEGFTDYLIPYLMNDSVECILRLHDCILEGEWDDSVREGAVLGFCEKEKLDEKAEVDMQDEEMSGQRESLMFQQAQGNIVTIHFQTAYLEGHCYQYHRIGHMWRRIPGEEHLRRIVNLLCVLHDKCNYLGQEFMNEKEEKLMHLITFAPLCFWTPINESIQEWYPETAEGIKAMKDLVKEAGDESYYHMICEYEKAAAAVLEPYKGAHFANEVADHEKRSNGPGSRKSKYEILQTTLAMELADPSHLAIYELLVSKIEEASLFWEERDYGKEKNENIAKVRDDAISFYQKKGYRYDADRRKMTDPEGGEVLFVEEHPFTTMEWEDYHYRIFAMEFSGDHKVSRYIEL